MNAYQNPLAKITLLGQPLINRIAIALIALSPFIQDVKANQRQWDKRLEKLYD